MDFAEFVGKADVKTYTVLRCEEYPCSSRTCAICEKVISEEVDHDVVYENGTDGIGFTVCDFCLAGYEKEATRRGATRE